jgi:hypothetical protein
VRNWENEAKNAENRLPATLYPEAQIGSQRARDFNDLENRKSGGTPPRDTASRRSITEALDYLDQNLPGLRRGTPKHQHLVARVKTSGRPLATACRDHLKIPRAGPECDPSDVQELWVKVFKRQGRMIYPEQERIFRNLDRDAIQGNLSRGDLDRADKVLRTFRAPGTLDRSWVRAELHADLALSGPAS